MAGKIVVSTLNDDTGVLATQNGMTGIAKAWVNFNGTGTVAIRDSFNVSSITDNGTGDYTVNFTTAMPNANYIAIGSAGTTGTDGNSQFWVWQKDTGNRTTTAVRFVSTQHGTDAGWGPNATDVSQFNVAVFSS
jgi:hypothetical protein